MWIHRLLFVVCLSVCMAACGSEPAPTQSRDRPTSGDEDIATPAPNDEPSPEPAHDGAYRLVVDGSSATITRPCAEGAPCPEEAIALVRATDQCGLVDLASGVHAPASSSISGQPLVPVMIASLAGDAGFPALACIYPASETEPQALVIHALRSSAAVVVFGLYHDGTQATLHDRGGDVVSLRVGEESEPWEGPGMPPHPRQWSFEFRADAFYGGGVEGPAIADALR